MGICASAEVCQSFAIIVVGTAIAYSSMIFQTITNNRILTPSILGLDSLYVLLQTGIIYFFGAAKLADLGKNGNFYCQPV